MHESAFDAVDGSPPPRHLSAIEAIAAGAVAVLGEPSMQAITTVGLDIAKSVFQVHGVDAEGQVVIHFRIN